MAARRLYTNSRTFRYRALEALFIALALLFAALAWSTRISDPANNHATFTILCGLTVVMVVAYGLFLRRCVSRLERDHAVLTIETLAAFGRRRFETTFADARFSKAAGKAKSGATHLTLRVPGSALPFIIDTTVDRLERE
jgi:hypothetical protein